MTDSYGTRRRGPRMGRLLIAAVIAIGSIVLMAVALRIRLRDEGSCALPTLAGSQERK